MNAVAIIAKKITTPEYQRFARGWK